MDEFTISFKCTDHGKHEAVYFTTLLVEFRHRGHFPKVSHATDIDGQPVDLPITLECPTCHADSRTIGKGALEKIAPHIAEFPTGVDISAFTGSTVAKPGIRQTVCR